MLNDPNHIGVFLGNGEKERLEIEKMFVELFNNSPRLVFLASESDFKSTVEIIDPYIDKTGKRTGIEMWAFPIRPDMYGAPGTLVYMEGLKAGSNSVLVYFSCADSSAESAKAEKSGGHIQ